MLQPRLSGAWQGALRQGAPGRRLAVWFGAIGLLLMLFAVRAGSGAEFAFATLALLPVIWIAWEQGRAAGLMMALLAAASWIAGDIGAEREFPNAWVPWFNGLVRAGVYGLVAWLTASLRAALLREHTLATRDSLTGLFNRRHFLEAGALEVERANRHGRAVAVLFLDLDNFKRLNDERGHDAGDMALGSVARVLQQDARATDLLARLGGDEFAVMLSEVTFEAAEQAAQRLAEAVKQAATEYPGLSVSVGGAWYGGHKPLLRTMLNEADGALRRAKHAGDGEVIILDCASAAAWAA